MGSSVSCVITNWNRKDDLKDVLNCIEKSTRFPEEVIVVDNASDDGSIDMVRREFPYVKLIVMPHNRYGACTTYNIGIATTRCDYVILMDNDITFPEDTIELLVRKMDTLPMEVAIISPFVWNDYYGDGHPQLQYPRSGIWQMREMTYFHGAFALCRRKILMQYTRLYDEKYYLYANEPELTLQLLIKGFKVLCVPTAPVQSVDVIHKARMTMRNDDVRLPRYIRNCTWTLWMHYPLRVWWWVWSGQMSYNLFAAFEGDRVKLRYVIWGTILALGGIWHCWRHREVIDELGDKESRFYRPVMR